jgi:hypothetical protein
MSDQSMTLTVVSPTDNASFELSGLTPDMRPDELVSELVAQGQIPTLPSGQSYQLALKGGHQLDDSQSLGENGVTDGATVQLLVPTPGAEAKSGRPEGEANG